MPKKSVSSFILKTWEMLNQEENSSVLRWLPDGNSFEVTDEIRFCSQILPQYFRHSNLSSFVRQLNMYNFHKQKSNDGLLQFYHKLFRKNQKQLLIGIRRKPSEAEIQSGDELLRQFLPECQQQDNTIVEEANDIINEEANILAYPQMEDKIQQSLEQNRQALCMMEWMVNSMNGFNGFYNLNEMKGCEFERWRMQKAIIPTIIIKKPPSCQDIQNRGY